MMVKSFRLKNCKEFLFCLILLISFKGLGQTKEILDEYRAKYPGHHVVLKENNYRITIEMIKGIPQVVHHVHTEHLILDQNGLLSLSEEFIQHSSFENLKINEAYVVVPTEKGSKKVPVTQIGTQDAETEGSVFYDDTKVTSLIFPRMEIGALRVLDYTIVMNEFKFPFGFNFASYFPMVNSNFEIEMDTCIHTIVHDYNFSEAKIDHSDLVVKNKRTLKWSAQNPPTLKLEDGSPNRKYYFPHVWAQIGYYYSKQGNVKVLNDLTDLHKWYFTNIKEVINETPSSEIKTISDSITKSIDNEFDKTKAIYYWVQNNIKYIAFEEGINGFVPRQPSAIIKKRYGDCKDMASLIYCMLKSVGIESHLTWVGSRDLPYRYTDFPSTTVDNHMITTYKHDGKNYFLDATNNFLAIDDYASFTQGKEVLVNITENDFEVIEMPVSEPKYTFMTDTTVINLKDKKLSGKSHTIIGGYYQQMLIPTLSAAALDKRDKAIRSVTEKGNNSFKVSNPQLINLTDREKPLEMKYDFEVDNYFTSLDNEIYINMVLEKDITFGELKVDRVAPLEFEFKCSDSYTVVLEVPEGYKVKTVPDDKDFKSDVIDYSIKYKSEAGKVYMTVFMEIKTLMVYPEDFKTWNSFVSLSKNAMAKSLVLIKNN